MLTKIKVVGIGGSGGNAISRMAKVGIKNVELIAINTDAQDLAKTTADFKLRIGQKITQGLGAGMKPEVGRKAALESQEEIRAALKGADLVFITCGLGGGTGSGATPIVAQISREMGILTIAIVTTPFFFEGRNRIRIAKNALELLRGNVDTSIVISNEQLFSTLAPNISLLNAFWACDDILRQAVQGISDLIILPGIINVNFADIKAIMKNAGSALFGVGKAQGERRAEVAVSLAMNSPLLNTSIQGARGVLFNVSGGKDISLSEINEIAHFITREVNKGAKIIFGAIQNNDDLKSGEIKVTVIATGF